MNAMRDINTTTLENGLRVVSDRMDSVETASVGVWVNAGTRDEHADINGISHLLEHMAFKGTQKRNAYDIASEVEALLPRHLFEPVEMFCHKLECFL